MLVGQTLALRSWSVDDAPFLVTWGNDPEYFGRFHNIWPQSRQALEAYISRPIGSNACQYIIIHREQDQPIGTIGYSNPWSAELSAFYMGSEVYYHVHPQFRGQGFATQAACLLVNHLFDATPIQRIHAMIDVDHGASQAVAERAGMQRDGLYRKVMFLHGRYVDMYLYAIVRDDWQDEATYRGARRPF